MSSQNNNLTQNKNFNSIYSIVKDAVKGDDKAIRDLIDPFLINEEKLLIYGLCGETGVFVNTYNFYFLTDRRLLDLEITPFKGSMHIEVSFIKEIEHYKIYQPEIPLLLRIFLLLLYVFLIGFLVNKHLIKEYLKLKKSGIIFFLKSGSLYNAQFVFFDRNNFNQIITLSNKISEIKKFIDR